MSHKIDGVPPSSLRSTALANTKSSSPAVSFSAPLMGVAIPSPVDAGEASANVRSSNSEESSILLGLQRELSQSPAFDEAKVQAIRKSLQAGTYSIDPEAIATGMIDLEKQLSV